MHDSPESVDFCQYLPQTPASASALVALTIGAPDVMWRLCGSPPPLNAALLMRVLLHAHTLQDGHH